MSTWLSKVQERIETAFPVAHSACGEARALNSLFQPTLSARIAKLLCATQLTAVLGTAIDLNGFMQFKGVLTGKKELNWDVGLKITSTVSDITDGVASIGFALGDLGIVAAKTVAWAPYFMITAAAISSVYLAIHAKAINENLKLLCNLTLDTSHTIQLNKYSGIAVDDAGQVFKQQHDLKSRITQEIYSRALSMLTTTIFMVGSAVFFMAPNLTPWGMIGSAAFALGHATNLSRIGYQRHINKLFQQNVGAKA